MDSHANFVKTCSAQIGMKQWEAEHSEFVANTFYGQVVCQAKCTSLAAAAVAKLHTFYRYSCSRLGKVVALPGEKDFAPAGELIDHLSSIPDSPDLKALAASRKLFQKVTTLLKSAANILNAATSYDAKLTTMDPSWGRDRAVLMSVMDEVSADRRATQSIVAGMGPREISQLIPFLEDIIDGALFKYASVGVQQVIEWLLESCRSIEQGREWEAFMPLVEKDGSFKAKQSPTMKFKADVSNLLAQHLKYNDGENEYRGCEAARKMLAWVEQQDEATITLEKICNLVTWKSLLPLEECQRVSTLFDRVSTRELQMMGILALADAGMTPPPKKKLEKEEGSAEKKPLVAASAEAQLEALRRQLIG